MRLKRVKIFGFKTFADRTEFDLDGGLVAVVGSNGCGKSNLVDAILWGLGEGNARQLRAATGIDVIFNGSAKRKPLGFADVTLIFDNEDGMLPVQTSEVVVSRRLTRNGDSEYRINRTVCRQRDVYELFADSGLGRTGYSIVGQKEVDSALSASPEERRTWIDEAAGVQRYRSRKVEAQKRLAQAKVHLERTSDIIRELENQRDPLMAEAEAAKRYKGLMSSLREIESGLLIIEVVRASEEVNAAAARIASATQTLEEELRKAIEVDEQVAATGVLISEIESEMDSIRSIQQASLTAIERAGADIRLINQRLNGLDELERTLREASSDGVRVQETEEEVEARQKEIFSLEESLKELRQRKDISQAEAKELTARLQLLDRHVSEAKAIEAKKLKQAIESEHRKGRRVLADRELNAIAAGLAELQSLVTEAEAEQATRREALASADVSQKAKQEQLIQLSKADDDAAASQRGALARQSMLQGRVQGIAATLNAHEGLHQGARAVLDASASGELKAKYRPVADVIEVDAEYAVAIETALGNSLHDLVVERDADAKAAIEFLKASRQGRATFQPVEMMRPVPETSETRMLLQQPGVIGRANELVDCEADVRAVVDSLLGRTFVVKEIDDAFRLLKNSSRSFSSIVTLQGELVRSSGAVTGGIASKQGQGMLQRRAELDGLSEQLADIEEQIKAEEAANQVRSNSLAALRIEIAASGVALNERRSDLGDQVSLTKSLHQELNNADRSKARLEKELQTLDQEFFENLPEVDAAALEAERIALADEVSGGSAASAALKEKIIEQEGRLSHERVRLQTAERRLSAAKDAENVRQRKLEALGPERDKLRSAITHHEAEKVEAITVKAASELRLTDAQTKKRTYLEESLRLAEAGRNHRQTADALGQTAHVAEVSRARSETRKITALQRLMEEYGLSEDEALEAYPTVTIPEDGVSVVSRLRREIKAMGEVNLGAIEAFEALSFRLNDLTGQLNDIVQGTEEVEGSIRELDKLTRSRFQEAFEAVQSHFSVLFHRLFGGGEGKLVLSDGGLLLESGIEIHVTLPGKKQQQLGLLSGGERSLCAMSFLFALLKVKSSPLVVLDEVDAPLDGSNVERFANLLTEFSFETQFIVITHNPTTIANSPLWLGVTMSEPGCSTLVPYKGKERADTRPAHALNHA